MGAEPTSGGNPGVDDGLAEAIPVALPERPEVQQQRTKGVVEAKMDRKAVARELLAMAKELIGMEFPTQKALDRYLREHPDADRGLHRVKRGLPGKWEKVKEMMPKVTKGQKEKAEKRYQEIAEKAKSEEKAKKFIKLEIDTPVTDWSDADLKDWVDTFKDGAMWRGGINRYEPGPSEELKRRQKKD